MYCKIALLSPPYTELTYALPSYISAKYLKKGMRVAIPLGNGALRVGIVVELLKEHGLNKGVQIKNLTWVLEKESLLNQEIVELVESLSVRQVQAKGQILANILPQALRTTQKLRLKEFITNSKPIIHSFKALKEYDLAVATSLFERYFLGDEVRLIELAEDSAAHELCILAKDPPWNIRPNAQKQREILDYLYENSQCTRRHLNNLFGASANATITALLKLGILSLLPIDEEYDNKKNNDSNELDPEMQAEEELLSLLESTVQESEFNFEFSEDQEEAINHGILAIKEKRAELRFLYGVTGSGKTATYLELARQTLLQGRSVFLLAPEVALAIKLKKDVEKYLPKAKIYFSHGYQSAQRRARNYKEIASEENPVIIIGTRSALFHSVNLSLGLIVLDEEHDASYKQDEKFFYHAKEIAWHRAKWHNALMIIGSATPDIKTYYAIKEGQLACDVLKSRVGGGALPNIELVDISSQSKAGLLSAQALEALKECLEKDEQAVILLNRRGYSPVMYCLECKEVQKCPHCSIALTYHKKREVLSCHYCNYSRPFPSCCSNCKSMAFQPLGDGTEKLEEQLAEFLQTLGSDYNKEKAILRLDRDSTRRQGSMEEILAKFSRKEASILVGTQMLSKGHHFPFVSLAIIADGDMSLNFPDYRAAERTFQLLVQSAGRAGRELTDGKVLIQTRDTKHYCWQYVINHDYENFYAYEIALRQKRLYPPFVKLALIRISIPFTVKNYTEIINLISKTLKTAKEDNVRILGPAASPIGIIQNIRRYQCLVKSQDWKSIRMSYIALLKMKQENPLLKEVRISLDIDPINML